jgi:hypothetical protein
MFYLRTIEGSPFDENCVIITITQFLVVTLRFRRYYVIVLSLKSAVCSSKSRVGFGLFILTSNMSIEEWNTDLLSYFLNTIYIVGLRQSFICNDCNTPFMRFASLCSCSNLNFTGGEIACVLQSLHKLLLFLFCLFNCLISMYKMITELFETLI